MKKIGYALVQFGKKKAIKSWIGDWQRCPGIPSYIDHLGVQVHGIQVGVPFAIKGKSYELIEVLGRPMSIDVDQECRRRINMILGADSIDSALAKQVNAIVDVLVVLAKTDQRTGEQDAVLVRSLEKMLLVREIRSAAKKLKAGKFVPLDFEADSHWPDMP